MHNRHPNISKVVRNSEKKRMVFTTSVLIVFVVVAVASILFVKLAGEVREQETLPFDQTILMAIKDSSTPFLDRFMPIATDIGGVVGVTALTVLFASLFAYKKEYARMWLIIIGVSGAVALNLILKSIFMRSRPDLWTQLVHETGYSFPSGHSMSSAGFAIALMVALWHSRWRWWGIGFGICYMVFVGFSRMYLGVHYPTDVMAGWLVSAAWVLAVALLTYSSFGRQLFTRIWNK